MPVLVLAVGLLGLAVGSFLNVVVHRLPAGQSLSRPPSACPACGHRIRARHNVPLLSWIALRGRCADCGDPISVRYPLVELVTASLFVLVTLRLAAWEQLPALPAYLFFVAIGVALSAIDLDLGRLPDRIVLPAYPVLVLLLSGAAVAQRDPASLVRSVLGAAATYAAYYAVMLAYPGGMGFGDVKLAGLTGAMLAYLSWPVLLVGVFAAFLMGAVVGVAAQLTPHPSRLVSAHGSSGSAGRGQRPSVPFGPFMVAGVLVAVLVGGPVVDLYLRLVMPA